MTQSDNARRWAADNRKAFECWNRFVERHGLPLAQFNELGRETDEPPAYEQDDGPLSEAEMNQIRELAAPKVCKSPVLRVRSLLDESDD
ncbi:MAG: type II toxin-antitoxin system CcdA family antitoxin [Fluviibacter sp.]